MKVFIRLLWFAVLPGLAGIAIARWVPPRVIGTAALVLFVLLLVPAARLPLPWERP